MNFIFNWVVRYSFFILVDVTLWMYVPVQFTHIGFYVNAYILNNYAIWILYKYTVNSNRVSVTLQTPSCWDLHNYNFITRFYEHQMTIYNTQQKIEHSATVRVDTHSSSNECRLTYRAATDVSLGALESLLSGRVATYRRSDLHHLTGDNGSTATCTSPYIPLPRASLTVPTCCCYRRSNISQ